MENMTKIQILEQIASVKAEIVANIQTILNNGGSYSMVQFDEIFRECTIAKRIEWAYQNINTRINQLKKGDLIAYYRELERYNLDMAILAVECTEAVRQIADEIRQASKEDKKEVAVNCKGVHIVNGQKYVCNKEGTNKTFHAVQTKNHGVIYMCDDCFNKQESYYTENSLFVNKDKKHGFTYSYEMELSRHDLAFIRMLQYNNFVPTRDCTVVVEYKSPIYKSLNGNRKLFRSLASALDERYFDYTCGTHCNIGHIDYINASTISIIAEYYKILFLPMSNWLKLNRQASIEIYGRELSHWAMPISETTNPYEHTNFINIEHNTHIEFRQCKFINENQYVDCVQLNTKIMTALINNFLSHYYDEEFDTRRYKTIEQFRQYKASVTANKFIQLLEKECDKKGIPYTSL